MKIEITTTTKYNIGDRVVYQKYGQIYHGTINKINIEGMIRDNSITPRMKEQYWVRRDNYNYDDLADDDDILGLEEDVKLEDDIIRLNQLLSDTKDKALEIKDAITDYLNHGWERKIKAIKEKYGDELQYKPVPDLIQSEKPYNITCLNCREKGYVAEFTAKCDDCGHIACFTVASLNDAYCMHCKGDELQ